MRGSAAGLRGQCGPGHPVPSAGWVNPHNERFPNFLKWHHKAPARTCGALLNCSVYTDCDSLTVSLSAYSGVGRGDFSRGVPFLPDVAVAGPDGLDRAWTGLCCAIKWFEAHLLVPARLARPRCLGHSPLPCRFPCRRFRRVRLAASGSRFRLAPRSSRPARRTSPSASGRRGGPWAWLQRAKAIKKHLKKKHKGFAFFFEVCARFSCRGRTTPTPPRKRFAPKDDWVRGKA